MVGVRQTARKQVNTHTNADFYGYFDSDAHEYPNTHAHSHEYGYANRYADTDTYRYRHCYADAHANANFNSHCDADADAHADANRSADRYIHIHGNACGHSSYGDARAAPAYTDAGSCGSYGDADERGRARRYAYTALRLRWRMRIHRRRAAWGSDGEHGAAVGSDCASRGHEVFPETERLINASAPRTQSSGP